MDSAMHGSSYTSQHARTEPAGMLTDSRGYNYAFDNGFYPPMYEMHEHMNRRSMQAQLRVQPEHIGRGK